MHRTGFNRWLCLLGAVPIANIIALWIFASAEWSTDRERDRRRDDWSDADKEAFKRLIQT